MKRIFFLVMFSLSVITAFTQQDSLQYNDTSNRILTEVVITGIREPRPDLLLPFSAAILSSEQLLRLNPRSTPEALSGMNGVFIQKTNHGGGSPFIRGLTGNQVLILQDGIRINNSTFRYGPNQYLNTIDPLTINRVEVAKGTGSVQYGTDAIGGVVQVITREPVFAASKSVNKAGVYGKYMTGDMEKIVRGEWIYSAKKIAILTGISVKDFGDLIGGDTTGRQTPSGYKEWSYDVKAKFLLKPGFQLILASQLLQQRHVPVYHKVQLENFSINEMDPQQRGLHYARLIMNGHSAVAKKTELTISRQLTAEGRNSRKNGSDILRKERDEVATTGITLDTWSVFNKKWSASSGLELYTDKVKSTRSDITAGGQAVFKRGLYPDQSANTNLSVYSLHHIQFGNWRADAGLRFNTFKLNIPDSTLGNVQISPSALVGNLGLLFAIDQRQTIYASWSSGFRAPNLDDMGTLGIVDFRYEVPAAALRPEKSRHTEIGYKFGGKKITLSAAAFYLHISNIITRVKSPGDTISGYPVYYKANSDAAYLKGTDASLKWQVYKHITMDGALAYTYGQNLSHNEPLRRIPPFNGRTAINFGKNGWYITNEYLFAAAQNRLAAGDRDDNRIPKGGTPRWGILNVYGGITIKKMQLSAGLQNLLNKDYRTHGSGINGTGRSAWISIRIKN